MKKSAVLLSAAFTLLIFAACGISNGTESKESSKQASAESTNQSSKEHAAAQSIFLATLSEDAVKNDTVDQSIRVVLTNIKAEQDPESMVDSFKNDGVILNVGEDQLASGTTLATLKKGDQVKFILTESPVMTMSIPPQIPGNSIVEVEKFNN